MSTATHTFYIGKDKKAGVKRQTNINSVITYIFPLALVIYQVIKTEFDIRFLVIAIAIIGLAVALLTYTIKKSNKRIDTMKLVISNTEVSLMELNKTTQIKFSDITSIATHHKGIELKGKSNSKNPFIIYNEFENFNQIKQLIETRTKKSR